MSGNRQRRSDWIVRDCLDQPVSQGVTRVQFLSSYEHFQRTFLADYSRQPLCASPPGDEAERRAAVAKDGVRSGNAARARQREIEPATHAVSMHGCDGRSGEVRYVIHEVLPHLGESKSLGSLKLGNLVEVGSGGEEMRVARDHEA